MIHFTFKGYLLSLLCILLTVSCDQGSNGEKGAGERPPNLVLILADDLGYADVGFHGCKDIPTPNIDRIAASGVVFTNGYVSWAACAPSRAGMMTGRYQDRFGFSRNPLFAPNDPNMGLPQTEQTLPEALKAAGYKSAIIGKWHLGAHPSQRPLQRGFDDFFGFLTGGHRYFPSDWTLSDEYEVTAQFEAYRTKLLRNDLRIEESEYLTDALSREAVEYIDQYREEPFFIFLSYNAPHAPMQAPEKYLSRFPHIDDETRKIYAAMVSAVDDGVGLVLEQLDQLQLRQNTMVVFLSDNGGPDHRNGSSNLPLRGRKGLLFEGGIRVPFTISWPGRIPAGHTYDHPVIALDLFPTILAQSGIDAGLEKPLDGVNLIPYLTGEDTGVPHEQLFWHLEHRKELAIRRSNDKLIITPSDTLLFDLSEDVGEQVDLAEDNKTKVKELNMLLSNWRAEMEEPAFLGLLEDSIYNTLHPDRFERPTDLNQN